MRKFLSILALAIFSSEIASSQERDLPQEIKALSAVCSSGASLEFRGQLEGGINRFFGKVLAGEGELEISRSEDEFLKSFEGDQFRFEARKIYNECVLQALQIVYGIASRRPDETAYSRIIVPSGLKFIVPGSEFGVNSGQSVRLHNGSIMSVVAKRGYPDIAQTTVVSGGNTTAEDLRIARRPTMQVSSSCWITYYNYSGRDHGRIYSFVYDCK